MASFIAKQLVGKQLNAVKGWWEHIIVIFSLLWYNWFRSWIYYL